MKWLDNLGYLPLILIGIMLGMAPWPGGPQPHLVEKVTMLMNGTLSKPIDIFDLFLHSSPIILILLKIVRQTILAKGE
jgi:hypothetical protein